GIRRLAPLNGDPVLGIESVEETTRGLRFGDLVGTRPQAAEAVAAVGGGGGCKRRDSALIIRAGKSQRYARNSVFAAVLNAVVVLIDENRPGNRTRCQLSKQVAGGRVAEANDDAFDCVCRLAARHNDVVLRLQSVEPAIGLSFGDRVRACAQTVEAVAAVRRS